MDIKLGTVIQVEGDQRKCLESLTHEFDTAATAFITASEMIRNTRKEIADFIRNTWPELDGFEFSFNHSSFEIKVTGHDRKSK